MKTTANIGSDLNPHTNYFMKHYQSPIGSVILVSSEDRLCGVIYPSMWTCFQKKFPGVVQASHAMIEKTEAQLDEYFAGSRKVFDLPLAIEGTEFQKTVWNALGRIGYGETRTYKEQAEYIGRPKAFRAVGMTDGLNPISIILPCHRVISSAGALTGYAGGLPAKKWLLDFEKTNL